MICQGSKAERQGGEARQGKDMEEGRREKCKGMTQDTLEASDGAIERSLGESLRQRHRGADPKIAEQGDDDNRRRRGRMEHQFL